MILLFICSLTVLTGLLYLYFSRTYNYWKSRNVAHRKPIPFFGNLIESALRKKFVGSVFYDIYNEFPEEKVVGIYRMTTPDLILKDLDIIKHVMIKDFENFSDRGIEFSKKGLGLNLFHADGDTWYVLRQKFTPIFTSGKLKNMMYLIEERGNTFIDYIKNEKTVEYEIHTLIQKYTMSTIVACAFGFDLDYDHKMFETLRKIDKLTLEANFAAELDMMYPGLLKKFGGTLFPRFVGEFFYELVETITSQRKDKASNRNDLMDLMLELKNLGLVQGTKRSDNDKDRKIDFDNDLIAAQAFIFFVAGYETSATTLTFLLYEIAKNPDIQDKLVAEIDEVLANNKGSASYEDLNNMKYMNRVFDETLRMYPIVDPLQRKAKADYKVPGTDLIIEKGKMVLVSIRGIHHDEKYYPNPEKFDPERFNPENAKELHSCAYMPFGLGPRNCIGMRFAKLQSKVCLVKLLKNFRVECSKNTKTKMDYSGKKAILSPDNGMYLNLTPRN